MRVTVGMIVGLIAAGHTKQEILEMYPYLEAGDIDEENEEGSIMNDEKYEEALSSPLLLTF